MTVTLPKLKGLSKLDGGLLRLIFINNKAQYTICILSFRCCAKTQFLNSYAHFLREHTMSNPPISSNNGEGSGTFTGGSPILPGNT